MSTLLVLNNFKEKLFKTTKSIQDNEKTKHICDEIQDWKLDYKVRESLEFLKDLINSDKKKDLELLASTHFLINKGQVGKDSKNYVTKTKEIFLKFNRSYTEKEITEAIDTLFKIESLC